MIPPLLLCAGCAVLGAVAQILFKHGAASFQLTPAAILSNTHLIAGMALYLLAMVLYLFALKGGNVSVLYPVIATSYVWVLLLAAWQFKEPIIAPNILGAALLICGVYCMVIK
jgi:drug/metabolite transporter (DMT)-like permease